MRSLCEEMGRGAWVTDVYFVGGGVKGTASGRIWGHWMIKYLLVISLGWRRTTHCLVGRRNWNAQAGNTIVWVGRNEWRVTFHLEALNVRSIYTSSVLQRGAGGKELKLW